MGWLVTTLRLGVGWLVTTLVLTLVLTFVLADGMPAEGQVSKLWSLHLDSMCMLRLTCDNTKRVCQRGVSSHRIAVRCDGGRALRSDGAGESKSSSLGVHCD